MRRPITHPLALQRLAASQLPDGSVDPLAAAIAIATHLHPNLLPKTILSTLDRFAAEARPMLEPAKGNALYGVINHILFQRHGFIGNRERYADPLNSYIDQVLHRHTGLPILLSLIYVETARRAGGVAHGIGLPGHFIVAVDDPPNPRLLIDAFNRGARLSENDCRRLAKAAGSPWTDDALQPVDGRRWALRMLLNLRNVYAHMGDAANTAAAIEQILLLEPSLKTQQQELHRLYAFLDEQSARNN